MNLMTTDPQVEDDSGEYEDLYSVVNRRLRVTLSQPQESKLREKKYPRIRDNPFFLSLQPYVSSHLKFIAYKEGESLNRRKKGRDISAQRNNQSSGEIDSQKHDSTNQVSAARRDLGIPEFQKNRLIHQNKAVNRMSPSLNQGKGFEGGRQSSLKIQSSTLAHLHYSRQTTNDDDTLTAQENSKGISYHGPKPAKNYKSQSSERSLRYDEDRSKNQYGKTIHKVTDSSQQEGPSQRFTNLRLAKALSERNSCDDKFENSKVRRRMTVPSSVERFDPPIHEIVAYSKIKTHSTKSVNNNKLNETLSDVPQTTHASHDMTDATKNHGHSGRVLTRNYSEPTLSLTDDQHTINSKRLRRRKRTKKKTEEESHDNRKSIRRRDVTKMMPGRVNSTRSLNENKRWKAYRASQGSSAWSSSRCHRKSMDSSISRLSGD